MATIAQQICLFYSLAWKHASPQIFFATITIGWNEKHFLFCNWTWKHYPVYIISQTNCTTSIFIWQSCLKTRFNRDCHHSNYQMLKWNIFFVSWPSLKMFCSLYYLSQVHSKYFCLMVRLENIIPWRSLFATIYAYTIYLLVFIIRQTILTVRLKNMISIKQKFLIIVNVIYTARKIKWEMMWSSRNTNWILFPLKNGKLTPPVLCYQVTQCSGSLAFSFVSTTTTNDMSTIQDKRFIDHTQLHVSKK